MKQWLFPSIFLVITHITLQAQVVLNNSNYYALDGQVFLFMEKEKALSINDIWNNFTQNKFQSVITPDNELNLAFVNHIYWLAVPLKNPQQATANVEAGIANAGIYQLEFYLLSFPSGTLITRHKTGKNFDFYTRSINSRHYYFPVSMPAGGQAVIFYRVDLRGNGFYTPLRLVQSSYRENDEAKASVFYAFFCGFLTFVSFFTFVICLWTKEKVYLFYSLYVACCCLLFLADGDFDFKWLYPHWPLWATVAPSMYGCGIVFFMLFFMNHFLVLNTSHKKLFTLSRIFCLLLLCLMVLIPLGYSAGQHITFRTIIYYFGVFCIGGGWLLQAYCIIVRVIDQYKPAYVYGLAILSVFFAAVLYILHSLSLIETALLPLNYMLSGFTLEILILAFALMYSYHYYKKKHQELSVTIANQQLEFSRQLLQVQENERKRIAEDLHDSIGPMLAAIKINFLRIAKAKADNTVAESLIAKTENIIDDSITEIRSISHQLMPKNLSSKGLITLLSEYCNDLQTIYGTPITFHHEIHTTLNKEVQLHLYRIMSELVLNAARHSHATTIILSLEASATGVIMSVQDNGIGFDPAQKNHPSLGIKNSESRVAYLNGVMHITSAGGKGVLIKINIPNQSL